MTRKPLRWAVVGCALACAYGVYAFSGYQYLRTRYSQLLVVYTVVPGLLPVGWRLLPFPQRLAHAAFMSKLPEQIQQEFSERRSTLYSVLGFRSVYDKPSDPRPAEQVALLRDMTLFLYRSGIRLGLEWVDDAGCTAIHEALILGDEEAARFLMKLGNVNVELSNPQSRARTCRLSVAALAAEKGLRL